MHKWDSRPEKPDQIQWTMLVLSLVVVAVVAVLGIAM